MNGEFLSDFKCCHNWGGLCRHDFEKCRRDACPKWRTCGACKNYHIPASQLPCVACIDLPPELLHN